MILIQVAETVDRLHVKDPYRKRRNLVEENNESEKTEESKNLTEEEVNAVTERLFIADYVNRHLCMNEVTNTNDNQKSLTQEELEESTKRLFIEDYSNRNEALHRTFYEDLMKKKKDEEKILSSGEQVEATLRLSKTTREPAECNKELRGRKMYEMKGIYGTYALVDPNVCKAIV